MKKLVNKTLRPKTIKQLKSDPDFEKLILKLCHITDETPLKVAYNKLASLRSDIYYMMAKINEEIKKEDNPTITTN